MPDREKVVKIFRKLINFADYDVHPVVSPENWCVYARLRDLIDQTEEDILAMLKEQEAVVRCKDCKYCEYPKSEKEWCKKGHLHGKAETWFCADGKRR